MKVLFIYPRFNRHADDHPELLEHVPMNEYLGSPSLGIAMMSAMTPDDWQIEFRDDRLAPADVPTDADIVALSFFTPAATRGLQIADHFRAQGKTVVAGGIFPTMMPDLVAEHVDAVVIGEGEPVWPQLLADFANGTLKPRYKATESVNTDDLPVPDLGLYIAQEGETFLPDDYPLQIGRGCMLECHACVLPTSMTSKLRPFSLPQIMAQLDQLDAAGKRACLTEDTSWFPGKKTRGVLQSLFDELIATDRVASISYIGISMPMINATPTRLFDKAKQAGVDMFYLVGGFDPITMNAFSGEHARAAQKAEDAINKAHDIGIVPYTSFLLGGEKDNLGTVDRILEFSNKTKIEKAEFAIATPYPGTPQWHKLVAEDRILTRQWSKYNDSNAVFKPAQMTADQLEEGYVRLWKEFYDSRQHLADLPASERTIQF